MPTPILEKESLIPGKTSKLVLHAPAIASHARPGHFVMLRMSPTGERIPLTIADTDAEKGTITIVYLVMGKSTAILEDLKAGDEILDVCGPLGKPTHIEKKGTVICVGGGTGIAAMHHIAKGHSRIGNKVVGIIGARNKDLLLRKGTGQLRRRAAHLHRRRQLRSQGPGHRPAPRPPGIRQGRL